MDMIAHSGYKNNHLFIPYRLYRVKIRSFLCRIPAEKNAGYCTYSKRQDN